ncbi:hypothetical protein CY34DRAFT_801811 [Suillus luteus UH-Slu-Lm8-n1]|uniref:Translation initiation factor 3 N-terminal domain-containing protein n=1 Tax=Suillus luteus UH-Slu-Lm8-n1 TaxID=930992 RepID=A0A0D0AUE6_9AGAM|nr:hypothetical protein CY34DRAFT_801811 [Suillus luteus UH-Slu-Lm8-n1]
MLSSAVFRTLTLSCHRILVPPCHKVEVLKSLWSPNFSFVRTYASAGPARRIGDDKIPFRVVRLVHPETGKLGPPVRLSDVLESVDLKAFRVELVTEEPEPIVKIVDRRDSYQKWKEQKKAIRKGLKAGEQKEIQITWGVDNGDLKHKITKARTELEKGYRVDIVIAPRKGQRLPRPDAMAARASEIASMLLDIAKEWRARDVQNTTTVMSFQKLPP